MAHREGVTSIKKRTKNRNETGSDLSLGSRLTVLSKRLGRERCCTLCLISLFSDLIEVSCWFFIQKFAYFSHVFSVSARFHHIWYIVEVLCWPISWHYHHLSSSAIKIHSLYIFWHATYPLILRPNTHTSYHSSGPKYVKKYSQANIHTSYHISRF